MVGLWVSLWVGCVKQATPEATDPGDLPVGDSDPVAGDDSGGPGAVGPTEDVDADRALWRALLDGAAAPGDVAERVAMGSGWPLDLGGGLYGFLRLSDAPSALRGDMNGWSPEAMQQAEGFSWLEREVEAPEGAGYKLHDAGDPDGEADPWARSYTYDTFGRLSFVRRPADRPSLAAWPAFTGRGLRARTVDVWIPAGDGPWPLVVMHDGGNLFDPGAIWGGWRLTETLPTLPELLVVGLGNTPDRMSEYTHVDDEIDGLGAVDAAGDAYADLVALDVVPWAEARWPLDGHRAVAGSSLGGLISLHTASRHPGVFDAVISLSGTLGWGRFGADNPTMQERWVTGGYQPVRVFVDSGGGPGADPACEDPDGDGAVEDDPDASDNYCTSRAFVDALAGSGWTWDVDLAHWWEPGDPHNELAWSNRVSRPLSWYQSGM